MEPFDTLDKRIIKHVVIWLVVLIALGGIYKLIRNAGTDPNPNLYQVVLLRNDQAYYGKLHKVHSDYPYLTDVYYLQPQQAQQGDNSKQQNTPAANSPKFNVIKRGGELHGPTDMMYIAKGSITYWENVGSDSLVSQGIKADKEQRAKQK